MYLVFMMKYIAKIGNKFAINPVRTFSHPVPYKQNEMIETYLTVPSINLLLCGNYIHNNNTSHYIPQIQS